MVLSNGWFFYSSNAKDDISGYCDGFDKKGTIITTILDMDKESIRYKIDDKDFGYVDAKCVKKQQKYRLAVTTESASG